MERDVQQTTVLHQAVPLAATLDFGAVEVAPERVVLVCDHHAGLATTGGALHGGTLMALADTAGAMTAFLNLPDGAVGTTTVESKTNFTGAVREGWVVAAASPLHVGSSTIVVETELRSADRLIAKTTQTQLVLRSR